MENLKSNTYFADQDKKIVVVELSGYLDQANCHELERLISELRDSGSYNLIFDFSDLIYVSSAGWGILIGEVKAIREKGGDIKITNMRPEVYEVYQILEFYHIIHDYPDINSAIKAFSLNRNLYKVSNQKIKMNETNDENKKDELLDTLDINFDNIDDIKIETDKDEKKLGIQIDYGEAERNGSDEKEFVFSKENNLDVKQLPVREKIKKIVSNYPLLNLFQIRRMLRHEKFGNEKIGIIRLYNLLKEMNLHSKKHRYRFYRSCE